MHPGRIDTPYNEHAHSYIDRQPAHRGMIYPPEAVAEAILYAAAHPKRDLYERGTHEGHVRRRSLYVDASTRPALSAVAVVALAGAFLGRRGLSRSRRRSG